MAESPAALAVGQRIDGGTPGVEREGQGAPERAERPVGRSAGLARERAAQPATGAGVDRGARDAQPLRIARLDPGADADRDVDVEVIEGRQRDRRADSPVDQPPPLPRHRGEQPRQRRRSAERLRQRTAPEDHALAGVDVGRHDGERPRQRFDLGVTHEGPKVRLQPAAGEQRAMGDAEVDDVRQHVAAPQSLGVAAQFGRAPSEGVEGADDRAKRRSDHDVGGQAAAFERRQHTDVGVPAGAAAAEGHPDARRRRRVGVGAEVGAHGERGGLEAFGHAGPYARDLRGGWGGDENRAPGHAMLVA